MICPKCHFDQPDGRADCARCGVVFAKVRGSAGSERVADAVAEFDRLTAPEGESGRTYDYFTAPPASSLAAPSLSPGAGIRSGVYANAGSYIAPAGLDAPSLRRASSGDETCDGTFGRTEWTVLAIGGGLGLFVFGVPFTRGVFSALVTLFHELGHAVVNWLLGHPAVPAFDFVYGGGITPSGEFHLSIALAVAALFALAGWYLRTNAKALAVIGSVAAVWLFVVTSHWRREIAVAGAGHAFEFILAGIFLYMAISGVGWRVPQIERPLGAAAATFVQLHGMSFLLRLRNDPDFLELYREGKGGALMNDLEVISLDLRIHFGLGIDIRGVAALMLAFSVIPFVVAILWYLNRARCHRMIRSLLVTA